MSLSASKEQVLVAVLSSFLCRSQGCETPQREEHRAYKQEEGAWAPPGMAWMGDLGRGPQGQRPQTVGWGPGLYTGFLMLPSDEWSGPCQSRKQPQSGTRGIKPVSRAAHCCPQRPPGWWRWGVGTDLSEAQSHTCVSGLSILPHFLRQKLKVPTTQLMDGTFSY